MKSNIHKKMTFEDRFDRKYACWANNLRQGLAVLEAAEQKAIPSGGKQDLY